MNKFKKLFSLARNKGMRAATSAVVEKASNVIATSEERQYIDTIDFYSSILDEDRGFGLKVTNENVPENLMVWVIPDFTASSGGHINIFRMISLLQDHGFKNQHVVIASPHRWRSLEEATSSLHDAFGNTSITVSLGVENMIPCQYIFATGWQTAYSVAKYKDANHKMYFVQDFEPHFYAMGSEFILAENTYKLGLVGITAGKWLATKLNDDYGMKTMSYSFACDTEIYKPLDKRPSEHKNILFYARPVTTRRCFEIGLLALKKITDLNPDVAVIFAGWDISNYKIPFHHLNAGVVSINELPDLYSQCEAALVLSATNLSLLPLELAACKCPVVMNRGSNADWLLSEAEAFYTDNDVDSIADKVIEVLENKNGETNKRVEKAYKKVQSSSWSKEAKRVARFLMKMNQES